jgi:AraC-like DNA-binding protein
MSNEIQDRFRYLPITQRTMRWGLYLTGCGQVSVPAHGQHPPGGHPQLYCFQWDRGRVLPDYQAIYLIQGKGLFESAATGKRALAAGDVFLLFPGIWHRYRPLADSDWETLWIGFNGALVSTWVENRLLNPDSPVLQVGQKPELVDAYRRIMEMVFEDLAGNPHRLAASVMEILALILVPTQREPPQPSSRPFVEPVLDRFVAEAVRLIWTTGQHAMTVSDVVAHFPTTRRSLVRRFHRTLGHTILDEIICCRVERAKQLLAETDLPLKAVAIAAGFSRTERMSKVFHRAEGVAPVQYRRDHRRIGTGR